MSEVAKTVLVVDDELTNRLLLRALLEKAGYNAIEAENGELAVQLIDNNMAIDIVLLDVLMPVMDGYTAARLIKSKQSRFIPIIFLTALTDESALAKCIDAGGDDFLTKPYNHVLLNSKIESMLRIADLYKSIEDKNKLIEQRNFHLRQEMSFAKKLFDKLALNDLRGKQSGLRYSMTPMSMFNGDIVLAEKNYTTGLDLLVADFTGHGLSAAVGVIPVSDVFHTMIKKCYSFTDMLATANAKLMDLLPTEMFMAAALLSVDKSNNVISVMNAGLPDIYLYRNNKIIRTFKSANIPLGIRHTAAAQFEVEMETLEFGDRLFVITDGVLEAANNSGEMYGVKRLKNVFDNNINGENIFDDILLSRTQFSQGTEQTDDITLLELHHAEDDVSTVSEASDGQPDYVLASDWQMNFNLDIESLRQLDVLPYIMEGVSKLLPVSSGRTTVHTILTEMFANALDHGVLKLDSSMKDTPQGYMDYYQEKQKRLETTQSGYIEVSINHSIHPQSGGRLSIHIMDSGDGFEHVADHSSDINQYSGRGLKLLSSLCTEMKISARGNSITAYYDWGRDKP